MSELASELGVAEDEIEQRFEYLKQYDSPNEPLRGFVILANTMISSDPNTPTEGNAVETDRPMWTARSIY
ncbi:hypothetical protein [Halalkalicoccus jeotgali]|uniref:Uncharacterized protein n=1 Tax=Halalkalicoccus jeotgali (strain DSM 18796 / CECT 7217 / JCM 14584 / KCTC 4019 / B3) TaxID=795797 RepID=D8JBV1_HALJB|nr:hypothetical protein [Halalkalicoccus jeotgali]ADJ16754.1 hypothetical protein HacjB3_17021 [Halalkalicoccus jeotgali B3]